MTRVKIFLGSAVLAAVVAVGGSVSPAAAGPAAAPPFAAPPAFVQGPPVDLQTPGATTSIEWPERSAVTPVASSWLSSRPATPQSCSTWRPCGRGSIVICSFRSVSVTPSRFGTLV